MYTSFSKIINNTQSTSFGLNLEYIDKNGTFCYKICDFPNFSLNTLYEISVYIPYLQRWVIVCLTLLSKIFSHGYYSLSFLYLVLNYTAQSGLGFFPLHHIRYVTICHYLNIIYYYLD